MILAFSGARKAQRIVDGYRFEQLRERLEHHLPQVKAVRHGDCIGMDFNFNALLMLLKFKGTVYLHPSNLRPYRAYCSVHHPLLMYAIHEELPPLQRNRIIVAEADLLLACPEDLEESRSGTWATIRFARAQHKPVEVI